MKVVGIIPTEVVTYGNCTTFSVSPTLVPTRQFFPVNIPDHRTAEGRQESERSLHFLIGTYHKILYDFDLKGIGVSILSFPSHR